MKTGHGFPLSKTLSRRGREVALMQFHCMDGTPITKIDIKQGKFMYPEEDGEPSASISDVVFKFRRAR
nr:hypothetical protein [Tanacetum cinerariifolium]